MFSRWNATIREIAEANERVYAVPVDDLFAEDGRALTADDFVHPNGTGYARIAERVLDAIAAAGSAGAGDAGPDGA